MAVAANDRAAMAMLLEPVVGPAASHTPAQMRTYADFLTAFTARTPLAKIGAENDDLQIAAMANGGIFGEAGRLAADPAAPLEARLAGVNLLGWWPDVPPGQDKTLSSLLTPRTPAEL